MANQSIANQLRQLYFHSYLGCMRVITTTTSSPTQYAISKSYHCNLYDRWNNFPHAHYPSFLPPFAQSSFNTPCTTFPAIPNKTKSQFQPLLFLHFPSNSDNLQTKNVHIWQIFGAILVMFAVLLTSTPCFKTNADRSTLFFTLLLKMNMKKKNFNKFPRHQKIIGHGDWMILIAIPLVMNDRIWHPATCGCRIEIKKLSNS